MPDSAHSAFALSWLSASWVVSDCRATSAGELHYLLTMTLLFQDDIHPSVSDLAKLLQQPKSNVSRYVNKHMRKGYLEERIDTHDRRRRVLFPTEKGQRELERLAGRLKRFVDFKQADEARSALDLCMELSRA